MKYALLVVIVLAGIGAWFFLKPDPAVSPVTESTPAAQNTEAAPSAQVRPTVTKISWHTEAANPAITNPDDFHMYEQAVSADVTFSDAHTQRYSLGKAYGCSTANVPKVSELGRMKCTFADSGTDFVAYAQNGKVVIEKQNESSMDGSVQKTILVQI